MITHLIELYILPTLAMLLNIVHVVQNEDKGTQELQLIGPVTRLVVHLLNRKASREFFKKSFVLLSVRWSITTLKQ